MEALRQVRYTRYDQYFTAGDVYELCRCICGQMDGEYTAEPDTSWEGGIVLTSYPSRAKYGPYAVKRLRFTVDTQDPYPTCFEWPKLSHAGWAALDPSNNNNKDRESHCISDHRGLGYTHLSYLTTDDAPAWTLKEMRAVHAAMLETGFTFRVNKH